MAAHKCEKEMMEMARTRASFDSSQLTCIIYGGNEPPKHRGAASSQLDFPLSSQTFMQTIRSEGSDKQQQYWLLLAESGDITGSLAQAELGHGASLRDIETTAVYDTLAAEFVINSPTATSTKLWSAGLGPSASHAVVTARLIVSSKDHGPHAFIVPTRSIQTWEWLPRVDNSDSEPKIGQRSIDNSYATFDTIRIPRTNMLMGLAHLQRDGTYSCKSYRKTAGTEILLLIRSHIIETITFQLAQAVTIATRYSTVKTNGHGHYSESPIALPLIHKKSQHACLLGLNAQAHALLFASKMCTHFLKDKASPPSYIQTLTAGLTTYAMHMAATGVEAARGCCEGHRNSLHSGFPNIASSIATQCSWAGDTAALYEETAKWLMDQVWLMKEGKDIHTTLAYLTAGSAPAKNPKVDKILATDQSLSNKNPTADNSHNPRNPLLDPIIITPTIITNAFHHHARRLILTASETMTASTNLERLSLGARQARNTHSLLLIAAARAHNEVLVLDSFLSHIQLIPDPRTAHIMQLQLQLFGLTAILACPSFFEDGYFSLAQADEMRAAVNALHEELVPEAVALTDAWAFRDAELKSAIGGWDGDVHARVMRWVRGASSSGDDGEEQGGQGMDKEGSTKSELGLKVGVAREKSRL